MPQFQVLEPNPGFGSRLGAALGGGIGQGLSQQLNQMLEQKQRKKQLEGLTPFLEQLNVPKEGIQQMIDAGLDPQLVASFIPHLQKNQIAQQKAQQEQEEQDAEAQQAEENLNYIDENLDYTGSPLAPGKSFASEGEFGRIWHPKAYETRKEITNRGFWTTDKLYTHFNKGTITDAKLELIKKELSPRGDISPEDNRARINALKSMMKLPKNLSQKQFDKVADQKIREVNKGKDPYSQKKSGASSKEGRGLKKVAPGTPITDEIIDEFLAASRGDPKKAEEFARQAGYKVD